MEGGPTRSAPVIAVLPVGADQSAESLARTLTLELTGELARFGGIEVVAPASAAAVAGLSEGEAAARLDADYLLYGRLTGPTERLELRVTLAAHDAKTAWHEVLEMPAEAPAGALVPLVARVAATFSARLFSDVARRARSRVPSSRADFQRIAHAVTLLKSGSRETDEAARTIFEEILARDPDNAAALGGMALSWFNEWSCDFWSEFEENGRRAYDYAHRALAMDDRDPWLHLILGRILLYRRAFTSAAWYIDRALALAPSNAELLIQLVPAFVYLGQPEEANALARKAMQLNPYYPNHYHAYAAFPPFVMRDFERAIGLAERSVGVMIIDIPAFSAIACAQLGRAEQAAGFMQLFEAEFRRKITYGREPAPGETIDWLLAYNPFRRDEDAALIREGFELLRSAPARCRALQPHAAEGVRLLRKSSDLWEIAYAGTSAQVAHLKGLNDLAVLLARPGDAFHCLDLAGRSGEEDTGQPVMDETARSAVKVRLRELQQEIAEADDANDLGRSEKLRAEMDRLIEELSSALGLGGRSRRLGDQAERARSAVTWRIRHAVSRLAAAHPELGRHLEVSIRTGTFCCYAPERPISWQISSDGQE